jgi:hypothetical protein
VLRVPANSDQDQAAGTAARQTHWPMKRFLQLMLGLKLRNCFRVSRVACATAKHVSRSFTPYAFLQTSGEAVAGAGACASARVITAMRRNATTRAAAPRFAIASAVVHTKEAS